VKVTAVSHDERTAARGQWGVLVARLVETGETVLIEDGHVQSFYAATKAAGVKGHISKRETGFVAWVEEAAK